MAKMQLELFPALLIFKPNQSNGLKFRKMFIKNSFSDLNSKMPPGKQKHGKGRFCKVPYAPPPSSRLKYLCNVDGCPGSFRSDDLATHYLKYLVSFETLC